MADSERHSASFRDPSGFIYHRGGVLLRQVNESYRPDFDLLNSSGLLKKLWEKQLMVSHQEADLSLAQAPGAVAVLQPELLPFISHPWEWPFSLLKQAALLTLNLQSLALDHGMSLKDASAFNVQLHKGKAIFIDTLSFEKHVATDPWIAYAQFCRHFLAPLALMAYTDVRLQALLSENLDGIPLDLAAKLLPGKTKLNSGLLMHLHLHAKAEKSGGSGQGGEAKKAVFSDAAMRGLIGSLEKTIQGLEWQPQGTEWADYYNDTNYSSAAADGKHQILKGWISSLAKPGATCWDLGANDGRYSRIAAEAGFCTLAADIDPAAVEQAFRFITKNQVTNLHPLLADLRNPSPGRGWMNKERASLAERGPADLALALALIHHLAIGSNVPLPDVWAALTGLGREVIVEWVPKDDSQVQRMMHARRDIFDRYTETDFESALPKGWKIKAKERIPESGRILYWAAME
jgi:SAM-dependent methyltransferase